MTDLLSCPSNDAIVEYLYEESSPADRRAIDEHLRGCARCRDEVAALGGVRTALADWHAPEMPVRVRLEQARAARPSPWMWLRTPAFPLAAAATLVLGFAAGMARLDVSYGADGWRVTTGGARADAAAPPATVSRAAGTGEAGPAVSRPASLSGSSAAPWRDDLRALEARLRTDLAPSGAPSRVQASDGVTAALSPEAARALLQRVQALIDESEVRQQRNLALRVAEVTRDFDLQRRSDLVQIQQGLGRIEGRTAAETARTREQLMNYIVRVSGQQQSPQ